MLRKAMLWAAVSCVYALAVLIVATARQKAFAPGMLLDPALAIVGVCIYAFIAAGIGVMATNPLEQRAQRRVRPTVAYLYMLLVSLYAYGIYTPNLWHKGVQVILCALVAYAIWQKVADRMPLLLDPTALPAPKVGVSDGLIAKFQRAAARRESQLVHRAHRDCRLDQVAVLHAVSDQRAVVPERKPRLLHRQRKDVRVPLRQPYALKGRPLLEIHIGHELGKAIHHATAIPGHKRGDWQMLHKPTKARIALFQEQRQKRRRLLPQRAGDDDADLAVGPGAGLRIVKGSHGHNCTLVWQHDREQLVRRQQRSHRL